MELSEIEQCKTWEEEMYWKYFHVMHFYLVLPKDFHDYLVLPSKFAGHVSSKLPNNVSLVGPSKFSWDVEVSKTDSLAFVGDGWKDFAKAYDLEENVLMLFKYKQNSSFEVLIFDQKNLCEKEFSYFVKKTFPKPNSRIDKKKSVVEAAITEMTEDNGGGGGFESVKSRYSKKGASVNGTPRASPSDGSSEDNLKDPDYVVSDKASNCTMVEKMEVLSESEECKKWEEEMYWKHFHAMRFYQVLPKDFHVQLVLPSKFAEHMSSKLLNKVSLIGPTGATWDVTVSKTGSLALVGDGWQDFAKTYNLEENLLMIFKYKQNSSFEVLIFNQNNLCEKETSYFVKKCLSEPSYRIDRKKSVVQAASTEIMEDDDGGDDGGSECVLSNKSKKGVANEGHRNMRDVPRTCSSDEFSKDNHNDPDFLLSDRAIDIVVERVSSGGRKNHHGSKSCVSNEAAAQYGGGSECVLFKKRKKGISDSKIPEAPKTCSSDDFSEDNHNDPDFVLSDKAIATIAERVSLGGRKNRQSSKSRVSNEAAAQDGAGSECVLFKKPKKDIADSNISEAPKACSSDDFSQNNHNDPDLFLLDKTIDIMVEGVSSGGRTNRHGSRSCVSNEAAAQDGGRLSETAKSSKPDRYRYSKDNQIWQTGHFRVESFSETVNGDSSPGMNHSRRSSRKRGRQTKRVLPKSSKKSVFKCGTKRLSKEYMSNRRLVTSGEKEDALRRATEAFTKGSFIAVMRPTSVYKRFYLTIPSDWMLKNLPRRQQQVILRTGEKTWGTTFHSYTYRGLSGGLAAGWKNFAIQNNLEDSDVCLFKPATVKDDATLVLDVEIFRVVQEITPLTPLICSI